LGVLPWPQTWMVQSQGIPAVEFEATCDLIFNKYDKDVSLGRWVRVGCGRMNLSGLCCLHSLLMSGSIPMGCRKKTSSTNNCVEKTKDRSISWYIYIYWVCVFSPALTSKPNLYCNETWKYLGGVEQCLMSHAKVCITVPLDCCILGVQGLLIQIRV
jgi:hypothetical protein